jgi:hypothetical protein
MARARPGDRRRVPARSFTLTRGGVHRDRDDPRLREGRREKGATSMMTEKSIKRRTAGGETAQVIEMIEGETTLAEASRPFDPTPSGIAGGRGCEAGDGNALRANPLGIRVHSKGN